MKNNKPWYEKVNIWVGVVAGICTILMFAYDFIKFLDANTTINSDEDGVAQLQEDNSNINVFIDNNIFPQIDNNSENVSDEYIKEWFDIDSLETASYVKVRVRNSSTNYPVWSSMTSIHTGERIEFQIEYKNTSNYEQNDVVIFNSLPENVKYIEGTLKKHDTKNPSGIRMNPDELFTDKGLNIGSFRPGANTYIDFTVEVIGDGLTNGKKTLLNELSYEIGTEKNTISQDYAYKACGWGPERSTYTMDKPADCAVFNSIADNAAIGDERDFVRIAEKNAGTVYSSEIIVEPDKQYSVFIYYHNNASSQFNSEEYDRIGFASNTRVSSFFPSSLIQGERQAVLGCISSTSTNPESVWDSAYITAKEDMTLHFVPDSAKIYNSKAADQSILPTSLFTDGGTYIGTNELNGLVPGCDEYAGMIIYTIQTMPVEKQIEESGD